VQNKVKLKLISFLGRQKFENGLDYGFPNRKHPRSMPKRLPSQIAPPLRSWNPFAQVQK